MQIIDQMIAEIVNLFIDFLSKYWLLGGGIILGFPCTAVVCADRAKM